MIGAGTFINPLIKVITTVAILAAVYFFFVKPALDTTEDISNSFGSSFGDITDDFQKQLRQNDLPTGTGSYSISSNNKKAVDRATKCLAKAPDAAAAQDCVEGIEK